MKILNTIKKFLPFVLIGVLVLALICLFLPAGAMKYDGKAVEGTKAMGWGLIFGKKYNNGYTTYQVYNFSGGGFTLLLFFLIFGAASVALTFFKGMKKIGKFAILASGATLCIATFFFLGIKNAVNFGDYTVLYGYYKPRIACYLGGFITFFAGIGTILLAVLEDKSFGLGTLADDEAKEEKAEEAADVEEIPVEE